MHKHLLILFTTLLLVGCSNTVSNTTNTPITTITTTAEATPEQTSIDYTKHYYAYSLKDGSINFYVSGYIEDPYYLYVQENDSGVISITIYYDIDEQFHLNDEMINSYSLYPQSLVETMMQESDRPFTEGMVVIGWIDDYLVINTPRFDVPYIPVGYDENNQLIYEMTLPEDSNGQDYDIIFDGLYTKEFNYDD